jgi:hypothetical protein
LKFVMLLTTTLSKLKWKNQITKGKCCRVQRLLLTWPRVAEKEADPKWHNNNNNNNNNTVIKFSDGLGLMRSSFFYFKFFLFVCLSRRNRYVMCSILFFWKWHRDGMDG